MTRTMHTQVRTSTDTIRSLFRGTTTTLVTLLLLTFAFGTGCDLLRPGSGASEPSEGQVPYQSLDGFFAERGVEGQSFTISADSRQVVTGDKGIKLHVPANAFVDQNGNPVSGSVTLELKEIYSPESMIETNATTETASGEPLITGGMFRIEARQDGEELSLPDSNWVGVEMPARTNTGNINSMRLWTSDRSSVAQDPDWRPVSEESAAFLEREGEAEEPTWYTSVRDLGFINIDVLNDETPTAELTINQSGYTGDPANFRVFVYSSNPTGLLPASVENGAFVRGDLPTGSYTVVAIGVDEGTQYFGTKEVTLNGDRSVTVDVAPTSTADLEAALSQL